MYVCICKSITDTQIRNAVNSGAESMREVKTQLGVSTQCGRCACEVRDLVRATLEDRSGSPMFYQVA